MILARCARCGRTHRDDLPCWQGKYRERVCAEVFSLQGRRCWVCGKRADAVDHIKPRSHGGGDELENLRPVCINDNSRRVHSLNPFKPDPLIAPPALSARWARE